MIYTLITTALVLINMLLVHNPVFGGLAVLLYIGSLGYVLGNALFSETLDRYSKTVIGSLFVLTGAIIGGAVIFYIWNITTISLVVLTILITLIVWLISWKCPAPNITHKRWILSIAQIVRYLVSNVSITFPHIVVTIAYAVLAILLVALLIAARSGEAIQTPWEVVSPFFFVVYAGATAVLLFSVLYQKYTRLHTVLISVHLLITYAVTNLVYAIHFGFDPFVHQATEKLLLETGTITPTPFMYVGYYTLVTWLHKLSSISLTVIDSWLVPALAALALPAIIRYALIRAFDVSERFAGTATLTLPLFSLPFFFSVPQNLGNLLLLITIFFSLPLLFSASNKSDRHYVRHIYLSMSWIMGIATMTIHPFSAVPLLAYVFFVSAVYLKRVFPAYTIFIRTIMAVGGIMACVAIPVALLTVFGGANTSIAGTLTLPTTTLSWIPFYSPFHLVYFFNEYSIWIFVFVAILGGYGLYTKKNLQNATPILYTTLVVLGIIVALRFVPLPIIGYESAEFIRRFWQIIGLLLLPLVYAGVAYIVDRYHQHTHRYMVPIVGLFLVLFTTIGMYLTYPRNDAFTKSRSFATSVYDQQAVQWIENDAHGKEYVVLSNQAVAAAALNQYGFKKYYDSLFYYPIPTTSPLYQLYLDMVYQEPTTERMQSVRNRTGAELVYFVMNDYWLDAEKRIEQATATIGEPITITNFAGKSRVTIFKLEGGR